MNHLRNFFITLQIAFLVFTPLSVISDPNTPHLANLHDTHNFHQISKSAENYYFLRWSEFIDISDQFSVLYKQVDSPVNSFPVDLNNDKFVDFLLGTEDGQLHYFMNMMSTNNASWSLNQSYTLPNLPNGLLNISPTAGDLNNDNTVDIIIGDADGNLFVSFNIGTPDSPTWTEFESIKNSNDDIITFSNRIHPTLSNINNDEGGKLDLLIGTVDQTIVVFENIGINESYLFTINTELPVDSFTNSKISFSSVQGSGAIKIKTSNIDNIDDRQDLIFLFESGDSYYFAQLGSKSQPKYVRLDKTESYTTFDFPNLPQIEGLEFNWVDFNGDNFSDLIAFYPNGSVFKATQYISIETIPKDVSGFTLTLELLFLSVGLSILYKRRRK